MYLHLMKMKRASRLRNWGELAKTAGAVPVGTLIQNRESIHPGTYLGKGKIAELSEMIEALGADGIICDDELSPAQMANLTDILQTKVMDRTLVYTGYIRFKGVHTGRKNSGRTGPVKIPCNTSDRIRRSNVTAWRRYRDERSRREKA